MYMYQSCCYLPACTCFSCFPTHNGNRVHVVALHSKLISWLRMLVIMVPCLFSTNCNKQKTFDKALELSIKMINNPALNPS